MTAFRNPLLARHALDCARPYGAPLDPVDVRRDTRLNAWLDLGNGFDAGSYRAHRALSDDGSLGWAVGHPRWASPGLSKAETPQAAIAEVEAAQRERQRVRRLWGEVRRLAGAMRRGAVVLDVPLAAAPQSRLAPVLRRVGVERLPGRAAGWLMLLDPRLGYAIWSAHTRAVERRLADASYSAGAEPTRLAA